MKIIEPYKLASYQGAMVTMVVEQDKQIIVTLSNRVSFIDARIWGRDEFLQDYIPAKITPTAVQLCLQQFVGYARSVGCTPAAAVYLNKLGYMQGSDLHGAIIKGQETLARIKKDAKIMEQQDKDPTAGKAPRKLGGAAAAAVKRKEERLAAEAAQLAGQVSEDMTKAEEAGATDARLPKTPVKRSAGKGNPPKITKDTPSADAAKKIVKGKANAQAQISADGKFDPSKLKNAEGEYKSASAMFKGLLFEGKLSDDKIAAAVDAKFSLGEQKAKDYVKWNRGWFRREGVEIKAAK